jgi:hypothetical protein
MKTFSIDFSRKAENPSLDDTSLVGIKGKIF